MAYPTTLDTFPAAATLALQDLDTSPHSLLHGNIGDALEAIEAKVGVDGSAVTTTVDYILTNNALLKAGNLAGLANLATSRTNLGLGSAAVLNSGDVLLSANNLSDLASASTARTNLGLGTMATQAASSVAITGGSITGITDLAVADGGTAASTAAGARTNLGLAIGTDVQAFDTELAALATTTSAADKLPYYTGSGTATTTDLTSAARTVLDDTTTAAMLTTLGAQPLDSDLTTIAGLTATTDNFIQSKSSAWASRTPAQVAADLTHNNLAGLTTGDPHTQYALLVGRSGGQTLIGGTASGDDLLLQSTSNATKGFIGLDAEVFLRDTNWTNTTTTASYLVTCDSTFTMADSSGGVTPGNFISGYHFNPTLTCSTNGGLFGSATVFWGHHQMKNTAGSGTTSLGTATTYVDGPTFTADTDSIIHAHNGYSSSPSFAVANGGTLTTASTTGFSASSTVGTGVTATARTGIVINDATGAGTVTTQIGVDVLALTKATTNIGIRNAATYVATPSTTQIIDAAADTILANAECVTINNNTGGSITVTSNPTIADGQNGQILQIIQIGAQNVVLTNGNNMRLPGAANLTLGQYDAVTFRWDTNSGQWVCIGNSNN